jgi:large subunit ribosomal protein L32
MGVPKRKQSKSRKNMRRSIWRKMDAPGLAECPQCHELKQPHRVCPSCGYYKDRVVLKAAAE